MTDLVGTNVAAPIVPFSTEDTYPTHDSEFGKGGWREVNTETDLLGIPVDRLRDGAAAWVKDVELIYIYSDGSWSVLTEFSAAIEANEQATEKLVELNEIQLDVTDKYTEILSKEGLVSAAKTSVDASAAIVSADRILTETAALQAQVTLLNANKFEAGARLFVPQGATVGSVTPSNAGTGGANGTFALAWTGGNFSVNPTGTFTVAGGIITAMNITGAGRYMGNAISPPTPVFTASVGLTGATATIPTRYLYAAGDNYLTDHATDNTKVSLFQNQANAAVQIAASVTWLGVGEAKGWADAAAASAASVGNISITLPERWASIGGLYVTDGAGNKYPAVEVDRNFNILFAKGGDVVLRISNLELRSILFNKTRSGILSPTVVSYNGINYVLSFYEESTGEFCNLGRYPLRELDAHLVRIKALELLGGGGSSAIIADVPDIGWAAWGNSMTAIASSGDWVNKLALLLNQEVYPGGTGGNTIWQMAGRQGGGVIRVVVSGDQIPASGAVTVSKSTLFNPYNGTPTEGTLCGVEGTLTNNSFTRISSGSVVACPAGSVFVPKYGALYKGRGQIIEVNRNSLNPTVVSGSPVDGAVAPIEKHIQIYRQMMNYRGYRVPHTLLWQCPPRTVEPFGSAARAEYDARMDALEEAFPENFVRIGDMLRTTEAASAAGITFTSQDNLDITDGITPTSFRSDGVHLTAAGGTAVAYFQKKALVDKNWHFTS